MISLPNNCRCSELKVMPKNWKNQHASLKKDWYLYYRFYDPIFKANRQFPKGKLIIIKGMNQYKILSQRRDVTNHLIVNV